MSTTLTRNSAEDILEAELIPWTDLYSSSFTDSTFNLAHKIIIGTFEVYEEARKAEIILHNLLGVDIIPYFANKARCTTAAEFCVTGAIMEKRKNTLDL